MAGRGAQTFKKRQKEQQRKEKQQEKIAKRLERKKLEPGEVGEDFDIEAVEINTDLDRDPFVGPGSAEMRELLNAPVDKPQ